MANVDVIYKGLLNAIIHSGYEYKDISRDVMCKQITSCNLSFDMQEEFPLLTTKKMFTKGIVAELIWFLRGDTNIKYLQDNGVHIWDKDAANFSDSGYVGKNYGAQWRDWTMEAPFKTLDQISNLLESLISHPMKRRHIVTAWNPAELEATALPPCHWAWEVLPYPLAISEKLEYYSGEDKENLLDKYNQALIEEDPNILGELAYALEEIADYGFVLKWHQRSVDTFLGLPFNIASYGILMHLIELLTGFKARFLMGDLSNVHIYENHIDAVNEISLRDPKKYQGAKLKFSEKLHKLAFDYREKTINFDSFINSMEVEDVEFEYESFEPIKAEMIAPK